MSHQQVAKFELVEAPQGSALYASSINVINRDLKDGKWVVTFRVSSGPWNGQEFQLSTPAIKVAS